MSEIVYGMTEMVCGACGIRFAVPDAFYKERREKGEKLGWHCPNGHPRVFRESDSDRLRRERDQLQQENARLEQEANEARTRAAKAQERAAKAERSASRLKKRAAAGTCPCCQRTFSNMATHMKHQHPEFVADTEAKVIPIRMRRKA